MNILDDAMGNLFFLISSLLAFDSGKHTHIQTYVCMHDFVHVCMYVNLGVRVFWRALPCRTVLSEIFVASKVDNFDENEFIVWTAVLTAAASMWALLRAKHLSRSSSSS